MPSLTYTFKAFYRDSGEEAYLAEVSGSSRNSVKRVIRDSSRAYEKAGISLRFSRVKTLPRYSRKISRPDGTVKVLRAKSPEALSETVKTYLRETDFSGPFLSRDTFLRSF